MTGVQTCALPICSCSFVVVGFKDFLNDRGKKLGDFLSNTALFPNPDKPQPKRVGREQGDAKGCALTRTRKHASQKEIWVDAKQKRSRENEKVSEDNVHSIVYASAPSDKTIARKLSSLGKIGKRPKSNLLLALKVV